MFDIAVSERHGDLGLDAVEAKAAAKLNHAGARADTIHALEPP